MATNRSPWLRQEPNEKEKDASSMYHGGSFKQYMQFKNTKLQEQFEAQQLQQPGQSELFKGVAIHVNGLTVPTHGELKQIMALHGGRFETYYHRNRVTHIICNNLPDTKLKQLAHARDPVPIVKPEWIVACLRAGQILPIKDYLLETLRDVPGQRQLFEFRPQQPQALAATELYPALQQQQQPSDEQQRHQQELPSKGLQGQAALQNEQLHQGPSAQQANAQQQQQQQGGQLMPPPPARQVRHQPSVQQLQCRDQQAGNVQAQQGPQQQQQHQQQPGTIPQGPQQQQQWQQQQSLLGPDCSLAKAQATAASLRASCDLLKGPPKSSADDPDGFVGSFFRSSRLHFIGTWKARIEALMAEHQQQRASAATAATMGIFAQQQQQRSAVAGSSRTVVHLDMDCFFAAVAAIGRPEFHGKPLAVCHSASAQGSAEVSSANYEARKYGIRAGMFMAEAKSRCPQLLVVPYEFDRYEEISEQVYRILLRHTPVVMPLSCDEAFLDLTGVTSDPEAVVSQIRADIQAATQCTASAGIGPNMLLARIATKMAKPDGQAVIRPDQARQYLGDMEVSELPGVGWSMKGKLADMGIRQVRQIWSSSKELLMRKLGTQTGSSLWQHAHGIDNRPVEPPKARRSVGAEVNWGVRFSSDADAHKFLKELSTEVGARLSAAKAKAKSLTLKLKRRQAGAPEPAKFLGHGYCDSLSRSVTLGNYVSGAADVYDQAALLLVAMKIPAEEIRGMGITASKLDTDAASHNARPSGPAPAKVAPSKHGVFDPSRQPPWMVAFQKHLEKLKQQQQPQQPQQQQQEGLQEEQPQEQQQQQQLEKQDGIAIDLSAADNHEDVQQQQQQQKEQQQQRRRLPAPSLTPQKRPCDPAAAAAAAAVGAAAALAGDCSPAAGATFFAATSAGDINSPASDFERTVAGNTPKRRQAIQKSSGASGSSPAVVGQQRTLHGVLVGQHQQQQQRLLTGVPAALHQLQSGEPQDQLQHQQQWQQQEDQQQSNVAEPLLLQHQQQQQQRVAGEQLQHLFDEPAGTTSTSLPAAAAAAAGPDVSAFEGSPTSEDLLMMASLPEVSPPDSATAAAMATAAAAAAGLGQPHLEREQQQQWQQQHTNVIGSPPAKRKLFLSAATPGTAAAAAAAAAASKTPIAGLPPLSQIDPEVLQALPSDLQREIAAAYNVGSAAVHRSLVAATAAADNGRVSASPSAAAERRQQQQQQQQRGRKGPGAAAGNWLQAGAAAAAAARPRGRPKAGREAAGQHAAFVRERSSKQGGVNSHQSTRSSHHHVPEVLTHMNQIDPEVLAQLPPELQQELQANLLGKPKKRPRPPAVADVSGGAAWAPWSDAAAAAGGGGGGGSSSSCRQVGLGRLWSGAAAAGNPAAGSSRSLQQQQQQRMFVSEPVGDILVGVQQAFDALLLQPAVAAVANVSDPTTAAFDPTLSSVSTNSGSQGVATDGPEHGRKLAVLAEYIAQWAVSCDSDLDAVRRVLRLVHKTGEQREGFRAAARQIVGLVQHHVQKRFGFLLKL